MNILCYLILFDLFPMTLFKKQNAFTLIELITVIAIIMVLMGLLFPAINFAKLAAQKAQAKNDLSQIITAVNAYYTEYGKYPITSGSGNVTYGVATGAVGTNDQLFNVLQLTNTANQSNVITLNPRGIVFISIPAAKNSASPKAGVTTSGGSAGAWYDPWGSQYNVTIDGGYANQIANPYSTDNPGGTSLNVGVIAWSNGKDKTQGAAGNSSTTYGGSDDVISWQ